MNPVLFNLALKLSDFRDKFGWTQDELAKRSGISHRYKKYDLAQVQADVEFISAAHDTLYDFNERVWNQLRATGNVPVGQR